MNLSRRQLIVYGVVAIALLAGVAAAAHIVGTVQTSGAVSLQAPDGMNVTVDGTTDQLLEEPFPTSSQVQLITEDGNATFTASGPANATIQSSEIEGAWTNITAVDADPNSITIDPADKDSAVVGKAITAFSYKGTQAIDDGTVDFVYSASANGRVTVQGVSGDTRIAAVDADSGAILDEDTSTGSGAITFDTLDSGTHDVELQTFTPAAPTLSDPSPTGGQSSEPTQISIDVNDSEFSQGDSVDVTIDLDGSQIHSTTISSNGTVTTSIPSSGKTGGSHSWTVEAEDSFGEVTTNQYSYDVPSTLTIFNESAPDQKVTNAEVTLRFFDDDTIIERTTNTGEIDLDDLPVGGEMVVVASADTYYTRRAYIGSIYEQQEIYLLNSSISTASVVFTLDDRTGNFPPDQTVLRVQRPLTKDFDGDGNDETRYQTIAGDYFGATGAFPVDLVTNTRYRLTVENDEGDLRTLGSYTATGDAAETLQIGQVTFGESQSGDPVMQGQLADYNATRYVQVSYLDPESATSGLEYTVVNSSDHSDVLQPNVTVSGPLRTYSNTIQVPASEPEDVGYVVKWEATRTNVANASGRVYIGDVPDFLEDTGLGGDVGAYLAFVGLAALVGLLVIYDDRLAAMTGAIGATALSMGGIITINPIALGIAGTIALIYTVARIR